MHMLTSSTCSPNSRTSSTLSKGGLSKFRSNGITTYETLAFVSSSKVSRTGTEWLLGSSDKGGVPSIIAIRISKPSVSKHLIVTSFPSEMRVASMTCGYTCRAVMRWICSQSATARHIHRSGWRPRNLMGKHPWFSRKGSILADILVLACNFWTVAMVAGVSRTAQNRRVESSVHPMIRWISSVEA